MKTLNDLAVVGQTVGVIAWRGLPYAVVAAVIVGGVLLAIALRGGREQLDTALAVALARPASVCQCAAARRDPHAAQEHTTCGGRLCGHCDTCASAVALGTERRREVSR